MMNLDRTKTRAGDNYATVYVAFELSKAKWRLGIILPGAKKMSRYTIDGGDTAGLSARLSQARAKAATCGKPVRIQSCYEAGFDGHLPKPVEPSQLAQVVGTLAGRSPGLN